MKVDGTSTRLRERQSLPLALRVQCREGAHREWMELTSLSTVTSCGVGFTLARPVEPGRLLHLSFAMPHHMRCFDHAESQYRVWSIVRYLKALAPVAAAEEEGPTRFEIGGALIGKYAPASYVSNPMTRYDLRPTLGKDGLWIVREQPRRVGPYVRPVESRLAVAVKVIIEHFDEVGRIAAREETETENISRRGAAVHTRLRIERGRFVRLLSSEDHRPVLAVVRGCRAGGNGGGRLHLEFIDQHNWLLEPDKTAELTLGPTSTSGPAVVT